MKKIYFNFETTTPEPTTAKIIEACFLFVEDGEIIEKFKSKIRINHGMKSMSEEWFEFSDIERDTLAFNGIKKAKDYFQHEHEAVYWENFLEEVMKYYVEMFQDIGDNGKLSKIALTGWNNAGFDNIILQRFLNSHFQTYPYNDYFDYHTRDIMHRFQILKEIGMIKGLSLSKCHSELIGTIKKSNFHDSEIDCIAVKDLDEWFDCNIMEEIK